MILVAMVSLLALLRSGGAEPQCASPGDIGSEEACSLNGVCSHGGCVCDAGWRGSSCGVLDLLPTAPGRRADAAYPPPQLSALLFGRGQAFEPSCGHR